MDQSKPKSTLKIWINNLKNSSNNSYEKVKNKNALITNKRRKQKRSNKNQTGRCRFQISRIEDE